LLQKRTGRRKPTDSPDWHKTFAVAVITRGDLTEVGLSQEQIDTLTDADMQAIADKMADLYGDNGYWEDLREAVKRLLQTERSSELTSLDFSRKFEILSISRLVLRDQLGFTTEQVNALSDADMERIAEIVAAEYSGHKFDEDVKFVTRLRLADKIGRSG